MLFTPVWSNDALCKMEKERFGGQISQSKPAIASFLRKKTIYNLLVGSTDQRFRLFPIEFGAWC